MLERPVFVSVSLMLIFIMVMYNYNIFTDVPCGDGVSKIVQRQFTHVSISHIMSNLFVFYLLSQMELKYGSQQFLLLLLQIVVICVGFEYLLQQITPVPCSIGFSGILFGLLAWELMQKNNHKIDIMFIIILVGIIIAPSLTNPRASLLGHAMGAVSGLVVAQWYRIKPSGKGDRPRTAEGEAGSSASTDSAST